MLIMMLTEQLHMIESKKSLQYFGFYLGIFEKQVSFNRYCELLFICARLPIKDIKWFKFLINELL